MDAREWLEADGLGGFASGTVSGIRTRRYHALLLHAAAPPTGRRVLVAGVEAWLETAAGAVPLSSQAYLPDVIHPDGAARVASFSAEPWPRWSWRLREGLSAEHELFVPHGSALVALSWRVRGALASGERLELVVRPLLAGRDYHELQHENPAFGFTPEQGPAGPVWRPYPGVPAIFVRSSGRYVHDPVWYRGFRYEQERERGFPFSEDLASPGSFRFDLTRGEAVLLAAAEGSETHLGDAAERVEDVRARLAAAETQRRAAFASPLRRSADAYVVRRGAGRTLVAGYPWFTDWGRDTFIALRGLCLATGRIDVAREIVLEWAQAVSEGMLPNRFTDQGEAPEYNSVDASLWYVVAVAEYLAEASAAGAPPDARERATLEAAQRAVLEGYAKGTRYGIRLDADGLLAAGAPGVQLTWMDARVGARVVTPRSGKPVEVQALWINALRLGGATEPAWREIAANATRSFAARFPVPGSDGLYDVVDVDHVPGAVDASFRPNQIFAVGGLPHPLLQGSRARRVVDAVEARLWTPLGLRSLAPDASGYVPHYVGGPETRDAAYHQGTVWPWLLGPFVEAWVRVRGATPKARCEARRLFLAPLLEHLDDAGLGHVSEIADAEPPHVPRGCPFQAWSLGELLRLDRIVLAEPRG